MAGHRMVFLKSDKLPELAETVRGYEFEYVSDLSFKTDTEKEEYLRISNSNMESEKDLVRKCEALVTKYKNDSIRAPIAALLQLYAETCINYALQIARNYTLRKDFLDSVTTQVDELIKAVDELGADDLTTRIKYYTEVVKKHALMSLNTEASKAFSAEIAHSGMTFPMLVHIYKEQLGFDERFEDLTEIQKIQVYDEIIKASGRTNEIDENDSEVSWRSYKILEKEESKGGSTGKVLKMFGAAYIAWDIYTAENHIKQAARDAVVKAAQNEGAELTELVAEVAAAIAEEAGACELMVTGIGFLVGFAFSTYIIGTTAGALFDLIFGSGGSKPLPTDGIIVHAATMPNGVDLAKQLLAGS